MLAVSHGYNRCYYLAYVFTLTIGNIFTLTIGNIFELIMPSSISDLCFVSVFPCFSFVS